MVDASNGFVLDPNDLSAQLERLERLANDPELRQRLGLAARQRIEAQHAYEVFRTTTAAILGDLGVHV